MPHQEGEDTRNVVLNEMNQPFAAYALSEADMAKWDKIVSVRDAINAALEAARNEKKIGKSLEAKVDLTVPAEDAFLAENTRSSVGRPVHRLPGPGDRGRRAVRLRGRGRRREVRALLEAPHQGGLRHRAPHLCPRCAKVIRTIQL